MITNSKWDEIKKILSKEGISSYLNKIQKIVRVPKKGWEVFFEDTTKSQGVCILEELVQTDREEVLAIGLDFYRRRPGQTWIARILGPSEKFVFEREFLSPSRFLSEKLLKEFWIELPPEGERAFYEFSEGGKSRSFIEVVSREYGPEWFYVSEEEVRAVVAPTTASKLIK